MKNRPSLVLLYTLKNKKNTLYKRKRKKFLYTIEICKRILLNYLKDIDIARFSVPVSYFDRAILIKCPYPLYWQYKDPDGEFLFSR